SQGYPPPNDRPLRDTPPSATDSRNCPCDLHVLSMPPAFALSQDQTLRFIISRKHPSAPRNIINKDPTQSARTRPNLPARTKSQPAQIASSTQSISANTSAQHLVRTSFDQSSRSLVNQPNQTNPNQHHPSHAQIKPELSPQKNPNITKQHL